MKHIQVQRRNKRYPNRAEIFTAVSDSRYKELSRYRWHLHEGYVERRPKVNGVKKHVFMHRVIKGLTSIDGTYDNPSMGVDHRNRNKLDNTDNNLRVATDTQNKCNNGLYRNNKSGHTGVYATPYNKWVAEVSYRNKTYYLGTFDSFDEACKARDDAAIKIHGRFAGLHQGDTK